MPLSVCFLHSDKARERVLADAFLKGASDAGDFVESRPLTPEVQEIPGADVICMVGVKSARFFHEYMRKGQHVVMLDKGYVRDGVSGDIRAWNYWRVAVDSHHPTRYLMDIQRPGDRWGKLNLKFEPWRKGGKYVIFAGSSEKYHNFYGLRHPTQYAQKVVKRLREAGAGKIVYRPKPSWKAAERIEGAEFSQGGSIYDLLPSASALVTHGSNACFESILMGVPTVILGDAVAKPLCSRSEEDVVNPRLASDEEREQWFRNLAYCQWTMREMLSGEAWSHIKPLVYA